MMSSLRAGVLLLQAALLSLTEGGVLYPHGVTTLPIPVDTGPFVVYYWPQEEPNIQNIQEGKSFSDSSNRREHASIENNDSTEKSTLPEENDYFSPLIKNHRFDDQMTSSSTNRDNYLSQKVVNDSNGPDINKEENINPHNQSTKNTLLQNDYFNNIVRLLTSNKNLKRKIDLKVSDSEQLPTVLTLPRKEMTESHEKELNHKVLIVSQLEKNKQKTVLNDFNRQVRNQFQKPSEFLRSQSDGKSLDTKRDDSNSKFVNWPIPKLLSSDIPEIISFEDGHKRYKYSYVSSSDLSEKKSSKNLGKEMNLGRDIIKSYYSIPTKEDAIDRLNQARYYRKYKEDTNSIKTTNTNENTINKTRSNTIAPNQENKVFYDTSKFLLIRNSSNPSPFYLPLLKEKQIFHSTPKIDPINILTGSSDSIPKYKPLTNKDISQILRADGKEVANMQKVSFDKNIRLGNSVNSESENWVPTTRLFGKTLGSKESSDLKAKVNESISIKFRPAEIPYTQINSNSTKSMNSSEKSNDLSREINNQYSTVPLAIQNMLLAINKSSVFQTQNKGKSVDFSSQNKRNFSPKDSSIMKKVLEIEEKERDSPHQHLTNSAKVIQVPIRLKSLLLDLLSRPTKEMIQDSKMLESRHKLAYDSIVKYSEKQKNTQVHNDLLNVTTEDTKTIPVLTIEDQLKLYDESKLSTETRKPESDESVLSEEDNSRENYIYVDEKRDKSMQQNFNYMKKLDIGTSNDKKQTAPYEPIMMTRPFLHRSEEIFSYIQQPTSIPPKRYLKPSTKSDITGGQFSRIQRSGQSKVEQTSKNSRLVEIFNSVARAANARVMAAAKASSKLFSL